MENVITMANDAGATVHNVDEHNAVVIFSDVQLIEFVNRVVIDVKQDLFNKIQGELK